MSETYVELAPVSVLRVKADWNGEGPAEAFRVLESQLPGLSGGKFYGTLRWAPEGGECYACVARVEGDASVPVGLEAAEIPGGWYARRRIPDWEVNVPRIAVESREMVRVPVGNVDPGRPVIEFFRSRPEMFVLVPVRAVDRPRTP
jgi:hypothetical protein